MEVREYKNRLEYLTDRGIRRGEARVIALSSMELSTKEISDTLGIKEATVYNLKRRGKIMVRNSKSIKEKDKERYIGETQTLQRRIHSR